MSTNQRETQASIRGALLLFSAYAAMLAGMGAKAGFDHYAEGTTVTIGTFMLPFLVSPLVFGFFLHYIRTSFDMLASSLIAFQNGFFWQDVFLSVAAANGQGG
ncbi:MAG: hypothetical protein AB7J28_13990 [Hyphomonadaceae bacterium]